MDDHENDEIERQDKQYEEEKWARLSDHKAKAADLLDGIQ